MRRVTHNPAGLDRSLDMSPPSNNFRSDVRSLSSRYIIAIGLLPQLAPALGSYAGGRFVVHGDYDQAIVVQANWVRQIDQFGVILGIGLGLLMIGRGLTSRTRIHPIQMIWLGLIAWAIAAGLYHGGSTTSGRQIELVVLILGIGAAAPRVREIASGAVALSLTTAFLSIGYWLIDPTQAASQCRIDKCGLAGELFQGYFANGNALGLLLCVGLSFLWLTSLSRGSKFLIASLHVGLLLAAGSRSALVGLVALLIFVCALSVTKRSASLARGLSVIAAISILAMELIVPLRASTASFTGRGQLWQLAMPHTVHDLFGGNGWNSLEYYFKNTGGFAYTSDYSVHNQLLEMLYIDGLAGVVALIGFCLLVLSRNRQSIFYPVPLIVGLAVGVLERPWSVGNYDWLSWSVIAIIGLACASDSDSPMMPGLASQMQKTAMQSR